MRRFLVRCFLWLVLLFMLEGVMYLTGFRFATFNGKEVFRSIDLSKKKSGKGLLILGDSVCQQLYPSQQEYPDAVSLACNQAVTMAGQFFLMRNYLEANADALPKQVVFICTPLCLQNDVDRYAFQYFLKPFYTKEYRPYFNEMLMDRVRMIPHYRASRLPFIRVSNFAFAYEEEPEASYSLISSLSQSYLRQMDSLATSKGVSFSLVCAPVRESERDAVEIACEGAAERNELTPALLVPYRNGIVSYPDSLFRDERHFRKECIPDDPCHLFRKPENSL